MLAVQIFDQKKFKKKDQGFLGVVNVKIGSVIDLDAGGDGSSLSLSLPPPSFPRPSTATLLSPLLTTCRHLRDAHSRSEEIKR